MKKTLTLNKLTITYDIEAIIDIVSKWEYDEESYDGVGEVDTNASYYVSKSEWTDKRKRFLKTIEEFKDETVLKDWLTRSISTNKNGSISKNRRNVLLSFDAYRDYSNSYGSHAYTVDALMINRVSEFEGNLVLSYYKDQSSF